MNPNFYQLAKINDEENEENEDNIEAFDDSNEEFIEFKKKCERMDCIR